MDLATELLMLTLLPEIRVIGTVVASILQNQATPLIAAISASGVVGAAIGGALIKSRKDKEIADLNGQKALELEELKSRKNLEIERLKVRQDLQTGYDKDLRTRRIKWYMELWSSTLPLARYPEPGPLPYDEVEPFATSLRDWYFKGGGLFMTEETRDTYFNLFDGLRIVLQKREGRWPFDNIEVKSPEDLNRLKEHLRPNEDWEVPEAVMGLVNDAEIGQIGDNVPDGVFDKLRSLGSSLRTNMANDVLTRRGSVLHERDQLESDRPGKDVPAQ